MSENVCPQCGAPLDLGATKCKYCGEAIQTVNQTAQVQQPYQQQPPQGMYQQPYQQPPYQQPYQQGPYQPMYNTGLEPGIDPSWPIKNKIVAALLAIFLGGLGIHKFYLGKVGMGILCIIFCWTWIPEVIGFIEGIVYLCSNDHNFQVKHHVRLQ